MKNKRIILYVIIGLVILFLIVWLYKRFLYFPHARVTDAVKSASGGWGSGGGSITWTNDGVIQSATINEDGCVGTGGTYAPGYDFNVECLPGGQFRFMVMPNRGKTRTPIVDNIFSFENPPKYLTK